MRTNRSPSQPAACRVVVPPFRKSVVSAAKTQLQLVGVLEWMIYRGLQTIEAETLAALLSGRVQPQTPTCGVVVSTRIASVLPAAPRGGVVMSPLGDQLIGTFGAES